MPSTSAFRHETELAGHALRSTRPAAGRGPLHTLHTPHTSTTPTKTPIDKLGTGSGVQRRVSANVYEQALSITGWQQLYDQLRPGPFRGELHELWLGQLQCFEEFTSRELRQSCVVWPDAYWFGLPCDEGKEIRRNAQTVEPDEIAIGTGAREFELTTPDDFSIMGLVLPAAHLVEHADIQLEGGIPLTLGEHPILKVSAKAKRQFIANQRSILKAAESTAFTSRHPSTSKLMHHELLDGLLELLTSAKPAVASRPRNHHYWRTVRKARDYILDQPDLPIVIADLCKHLNVSRRTLQNCFNTTLDIGPVSYLKAIRLNAVRRELLCEDSRVQRIQDIAAAWGFWHPSQFSQDYQRLFNEKPSETLTKEAKVFKAFKAK